MPSIATSTPIKKNKETAIAVAVIAPSGRLGRLVLEGALASSAYRVHSVLVRSLSRQAINNQDEVIRSQGQSYIITDSPEEAFTGADVVIDFSAPAAVCSVLPIAVKTRSAYLLASTGLSADAKNLCSDAAQTIPVLVASNTAIGVNILSELARLAAQIVPHDWDSEIFEIHHKHKRDAPSGTAHSLANIVSKARTLTPHLGRCGDESALRQKGELGISAARGGDVAGEHTLFFFGDGERIELTHRAVSPHIFSSGALKAALWLVDKDAGLYTMQDTIQDMMSCVLQNRPS